ncbi:MAG: 50S ribosomal protein L18e [Candidatus Woesearchaeota archaeon]
MKNQETQMLILELRKQAALQQSPLWKRVAKDLAKPTRQKRVVNLSHIERYAQENDIIIVPGKVLGDGELTKRLTIAAQSFSATALEKIAKAGAKSYLLQEYLQKDPKPKNAKLLG